LLPSQIQVTCADVLAISIEANCPSSRVSERAPCSVGEKSRYTISSSKINQASTVQEMSANLTLTNKATESPHSKLINSNVAKLLISIGDQFKDDSEIAAMNIDTLQIGEDLEELSLLAPRNNSQEVFDAGIAKCEKVWATQTFVEQWLDNSCDLPVGWRNAC
jgi:hypothetical protein